MTDSMKFGPEWLRNLSSDGTQNPPAPKYQLAEHRYGREEMLALFDRQVRAPERLANIQSLYVEKTQPPLALIQMTEEETRMWNRGINSDAVLRLNGKPAPINIPGGGGAGRGGALAGGRGGSVDRGRGRARGQGSSYHYTRGLSYEEAGGEAMMLDPTGKSTYNRNIGRPFDRAQSMAGGERSWGDRNGGDPQQQQDWNGSTSPRKEFVRGLDNNWRRPRGPTAPAAAGGEDEEGWRTATASGSTKYVRPSSWREGDKEAAGEVGGGGGRWEGSRAHRGWDGDSHRHHMDPDNLPEWAMENPSESGGSFDASGAFHGGVHSEDDEDSGAGGEPGHLHHLRKTSKEAGSGINNSAKRRSPDDASKKTTPPPLQRPLPAHPTPQPSIAKSQSTPAMSAVAKSNPAKTQALQHPQHHPQQHHQPQHHHSSQGNIVGMVASETAFQIPLQMSAAAATQSMANDGDPSANGPPNMNAQQVPSGDKSMLPGVGQQYPLNDPSILSTKFHHPQQHQQQHQQQGNSVGYDPAHYQPLVAAHNGNSGYGQPRYAAPYSPVGDPRMSLRKNDEDLDRMQEDADILVDKLTADEEEKIHKMAAVKQSMIGQDNWFYRDPQSQVQGPFAAQEMDEWFRAGYFNVNLLIRRGCDERFSQLGDLIKSWGRVPFLPGPTMPPLKNDPMPTPPPTPAHPSQVKPAMDPATEAAILQQQYQYQQLLQRQMQLGQQAAFQAVLGKLSQSERWPTLTPNEQQQLVMQQMVDPSVFLPQHQKAPLHQPQFIPSPSKQPPPVQQSAAPDNNPSTQQHPLHQLIQQMGGGHTPSPIGQPPGPMGHQGLHNQEPHDQDPIQSLLRQINANVAKPQMDVWGNPLSAQSWMPPPVSQMPTAPPPGQLPVTLWDLQGKDMKTEQQIIDERMRAEEEKRAEEVKKKEAEDKRRKQQLEEEQKRKELEKQRLEQERQRQERQLEEARRKEEEEEKRILEEQKRLEDEMRKKEEKKRKDDEKKKREEEKRKKDEEKERKRKMEEDRKREEEEKKRLAAQEEEEAARKRLEEEEQVRRLEQQHQAFRRMERAAKAAPWSQQPAQQPAGSSLAEIQRQEKVQKERDSREQQLLMQSLLLQQQQQQQQQQQAAVLQAASAVDSKQLQLKWAERKAQPPASKVKSLSEIQAEEAKLSEREKAERASQQKESAAPPSAGIWSAAPQSLTWATPPAPVAWGGSNLPQGPVGFWDDVIPVSPKPAPKPKAAPVNHTATAASQPPAAKTQAAKTRNKKEEAVVMKLFDNQRGDDFTHWCYTTLQKIEAAAHVDIPTFVGFLRDIESPYEVRDYVKMYLGEGKEAQEFARQFLERRSKWRSAQRAAPQHDDLAQPAPAINPSATDFQEVKGKAKKVKKNKMFKVDNRILGFSVTAAQDRINVGDRDYGEGV